jgi:hypothetical protein
VSYDPEPEIQRYLERLSSATYDLPDARRRELLSEIEQHIRQALAQTPCTSRDEMLALLEQVGDPAEIAAAADDRVDAGRERRAGVIAFLRARRLRNVSIALSALAVVGLAIGSVAWIQSYQPLAYLDVPSVHGRVAVTFHRGYRFSVGVTVRNNGRFTVRVLDVPYSSGAFSGLPVSARVLMSRTIGGPQPVTRPRCHVPYLPGCVGYTAWPSGPYEPFRPFDLKPGRMRMLILVGVYGNCADQRNLVPISVADLPIRYRFLWKSATARVPLPKEREIAPPSRGCLSPIALSRHLIATGPAGVSRVFRAASIEPGVRIFCAGHAAHASALVPKRGGSVLGSAYGPDGRATIHLTTRRNGSVVAVCMTDDQIGTGA